MTLKDLPEGWRPPNDPFIYMLRAITADTGPVAPTRVHRGVYEAHFNFDKEIEDLIVEQWVDFSMWGYSDFYSYGVVDHWSQLPLTRLDDDERNLLVFLGRIRRADQSESGGWRWHKWGPYLGVHSHETSIDHEYLYDATDVVEVWSYRVVEVR